MLGTAEQWQRAREAADFWLATVRPEAGAHLVPIWAVVVEDVFYMATGPRSQKVLNLRAQPRVALSLPDTRQVVIWEGEAKVLDGPLPEAVRAQFREKYDWNLDAESKQEWVLVQVVPDKVLAWNSNEG